MLDLQAQPRTTSVTRGAPDQGMWGQTAPGTRGRPPRCAAAAATPAYPASLGPQKGQMASPLTPTPDPRVSPGTRPGITDTTCGKMQVATPLVPSTYLVPPTQRRGVLPPGGPHLLGDPSPTGRALYLRSWTKPPSAATASLSH